MPVRNRKTKTQKTAESKSGTMKETPSKSIVDLMKERESVHGSVIALITSIAMGLVFGFALNKGRVAEPAVIVDQFKFVRWTMMKMFLSAASTSCFALSILRVLFKDQWLITRTKYFSCVNLRGTLIGGVLLGAGMAIGGACPGMVLIQVGCGVPNSLIALFGALMGAFTYGVFEPYFRHLFVKKSIKKVFLDELLNINYTILSFIFGSLLLGFTIFLESLFPWQTELSKLNETNCKIFDCRNWSPIMAGVLVGLLQIPCLIILGNTIGGSSAYVCIMGQWLKFTNDTNKQFYSHFNGQLNRWWQVIYVIAAIFGSMFAVWAGNGNILSLLYQPFDGIEGVSINKAFSGGFIMVFGARLAKGCTSGHGLSGMGLLSIASMLAVAAMFAGGAIVGLLLN